MNTCYCKLCKMNIFSKLDEKVVSLCPVEKKEGAIEDSKSVIAKIVKAKRKLDSTLKGDSNRCVRSLPGTGPPYHDYQVSIGKIQRGCFNLELILGKPLLL